MGPSISFNPSLTKLIRRIILSPPGVEHPPELQHGFRRCGREQRLHVCRSPTQVRHLQHGRVDAERQLQLCLRQSTKAQNVERVIATG